MKEELIFINNIDQLHEIYTFIFKKFFDKIFRGRYVMRIITGVAKGKKLKNIKGMRVRPTLDRVKESLFNILANKVPDSNFLDLFSGTGNIGLEALSRGAKYVVFVDNHRESIGVIKENIKLTCLDHYNYEIIFDDANKAIERLSLRNQKFNIIFMDPPYARGFVLPVINTIYQKNILEEDGIIVVEHNKEEELPDNIGDLVMFRKEKYGSVFLTFYKKGADIL